MGGRKVAAWQLALLFSVRLTNSLKGDTMSLFKKALNASPAYQAVKLGSKLNQQHSEQKQQKQQEQQQKVAETEDTRGNKLGSMAAIFMGGYNEHKHAVGSIVFYQKQTEFKVALSQKRSFAIPNTSITDVTFEGKDEVIQQRTITRNILLAGKSKQQAVKDTYMNIALTDGQQVTFHIKDKSPLELKAKLANVVLQVKQGKPVAMPVETTSQGSVADELTQLAKLKEQGILTETEFVAKKKQLLGL